MPDQPPELPAAPQGTPTLTVLPLGHTVPVPAGSSLLQAARAGGVWLPASCRNGSCRACLCRLRAGQVRHRIDWPSLLPEEKAEGWVLPCVAEALGPVTLEAPAAQRLPTGTGPAPAQAGSAHSVTPGMPLTPGIGGPNAPCSS